MHRRDLLAVSGALAAAALAGCSEEPDPAAGTATGTDARTGTATPTETTADPTTVDGEPTGTPTTTEERLAELAAGNAAFALDLHSHLVDQRSGNLFLSPYSISAALAMTFAGARGETRRQMAETLHYTLGEDVHAAFADLRAALATRETARDPGDGETVDAFQLSVANALWGQSGYAFDQAYRDRLATHYEAGLRRADFAAAPDAERRRINEWVAKATGGHIEDLLPPGSVDASTRLILTNAVHFAAGWLHEFDPEDTADGTFTALDGTESTVPLMRQQIRTNYAKFPGGEAVELPYAGDEVAMLLLLPEAGTFETFERELTAERLFGIVDELHDAEGELILPRFEFETEFQLGDALSDLGMPAAFGVGANFSGMVPGDGSGPAIGEVYHESFVSVDEAGTEAAAATSPVMVVSKPPGWGTLRFDRPFLFAVRDRPTDAILFLGRVVDAGAAQGD